VNLELTLDGLRTRAGSISATATGFLRAIDDLIALFAVNADESFQNVFGARALGVETSGVWTSPGGYVVLDGTATYQSFRNTSSDGPYGVFEGDRIPDRPYLFGSATARLQLRDQFLARDEITASYGLRYSHAFNRDWDTLGANGHPIPTQWLHSAALGYRVRGEQLDVSTTLEVSNLTDAASFDYFQVQRPGRAFYVKTAVAF
jgi:outer membrane receptor for monomeric catechols